VHGLDRSTAGLLPGRRRVRALAVLSACLAVGGPAWAEDPWEWWPEAQVFVGRTRLTRMFFNLAYARGKDVAAGTLALDAAAYLDISIRPIGFGRRARFKQEDWARNRYLWARIGYDHVFKSEGGEPAPPEDRGIVSLWAKAPLPLGVWLEGRARADLRWIDGVYSTRYRLRVEATREFSVAGHPVLPYFNAEWFYDTRYDDWARVLYQVGPEVTVNRRLRFEVFLARQQDWLPSKSALNAFGVVAKCYF
jgi:hypothetical protein